MSAKCKFCTQSILNIYNGHTCESSACQKKWQKGCKKTHPCGHFCVGIPGENKCPPCLFCQGRVKINQHADDECTICFTETLSAAPSIQLTCGHMFHYNCVRRMLEKRWVGPRIDFGFSRCPQCKKQIEHLFLNDLLGPVKELFTAVQRKAMLRLKHENLEEAEAIITPGHHFYKNAEGFAMNRYCYYLCSKCNSAYYGGDARCADQVASCEYDPNELICGACSDISKTNNCSKHGTEFIEYKCRYCCSVATYYCFGTTHFCTGCHDAHGHVMQLSKDQLPKCPAGPKGKQLCHEVCPLGITHPPTGEEFSIGCGLCRNTNLF